MLVLLLRIGAQRFAIEARDVLEVLPAVPLLPVPGAPAWIAGLLRHRDAIVPVVDLPMRATGVAAPRLLSSRVVVLRRSDDPASAPIGLLAEGVTATATIDPTHLHRPSVEVPGAAWLGPIALDGSDAVQIVRWTDLVPAELHARVVTGAAP